MAGYISSEDAAGILGVKSPISASKILRERGVLNQTITAGVGVRNSYLAAEVVKVAFDRRREALERRRNDSVTFAKEIVFQLRPKGPEVVTLIDGRKVPRTEPTADELRTGLNAAADPKAATAAKLAAISPDATMIFGRGVMIAAAANVPPGTCRWCVARLETEWGAIGPDIDDPAHEVLLGKPCLRCKVDLTPARTASAAVSGPNTARATNSTRKAAEWRQKAAQARARGDVAASAVAEQNARHWLRYGRSIGEV